MISDNLIDVKNFMVALLPVFSGISAASGEFMTSALYTGIFLTGMAFVADGNDQLHLTRVDLIFVCHFILRVTAREEIERLFC